MTHPSALDMTEGAYPERSQGSVESSPFFGGSLKISNHGLLSMLLLDFLHLTVYGFDGAPESFCVKLGSR